MPWKRGVVRVSGLLLCAWGACAPALAACKIQNVEIPVRIVDRRPIATLSLNGTEVPLLLDSGAFFSFLSPSAAEQLNLPLSRLPWGMELQGYTGRIEAKLTTVKKVGLLRSTLENVQFIVGGNELEAGIMGVLGRNFLAAGDTEYDLAHGAVRLSFPKGDCDNTDFAYWAGEAPVVMVPLLRGSRRQDTAIEVSASINGERVSALLDTGAPSTALSLRAAKDAGIKADVMKPAGRAGGAGEGRVSSWLAPVALFEMGGEAIKNSLLHVNDTDWVDHGVVLGLDYFLSHRIYVSRLQRKVYLTWNGSPIFPPAGGKAGSYDTRYAARPEELPADDADALARRGAAALAAGNHERALADLNRACELAPRVADYRFARARLYIEQRKAGPALADLDEALRLDPALAEARFRRAALLFNLGRAEAAQADLVQLDASLPPSANLRADMADLHERMGQPAESLRQSELWMNSHTKDQRRASVLNSRCWIRVRLNVDLALALEDCKRSVNLDEDDPNARDSLGWVYLRLGEPASARKSFDAALKLKPLAFSHFGRSVAHLRLGDKASSARDLVQARVLEPAIDARVRREGLAEVEGVSQLMATAP
jgi:tetratricopeptide (TPR) repeat protein/predicted aspartyl protease